MAVPYTFGSATTSIPLSQLDSNFATTITLGNTAVQLGNTITNLTGVSNVASATSLTLGSNGNTTAITVDTSQNVGVGTASPSQKLQVLATNTTGFAGAAIQNQNTNVGIAGVQFSSDTTYFKSAIGQVRSDSNGVGSLVFYNASSTGAANWATSDERMRIDSSGKVGIGTASPTQPLTVSGSIQAVGASTLFDQNGTQLDYYLGAGRMAAYISTGSNLQFFTNPNGGSSTERMRIDSSGSLLINKTSRAADESLGVTGKLNSQCVQLVSPTTGGYDQINFRNPNGQVGLIMSSGSSTSYGTSSDYRLKENIAPMTGALAKVAQLKPVTYKWKVDGTDGQGFIAHELAEVVPDCVTGEKDALDKDGNPSYQGIDTSFLVATLTAAIQELKAINDQQAEIINALTARIVALEAK